MKFVVLKYGLFVLLLTVSASAFSQKEVRRDIRKGNKAYKQEKYGEAYSFYDKAVNGNANSLEANYNLGNVLYRQKEWDKSVEQYNHYLTIEKDNPQKMSAAWHNIGNTMLQKKDLQKSMEAYKMALRLNPADDETRYNLAVVQKMIKDQQNNNQQDQQNQNQEDKDKKQDQQQNEDQQKQQPQDQPQDQKDKEKKAEEQQQPEQMSRDNARQMLQAIEQDEKETQDKVRQMKAEERKQKADDNRKRSKDW
ncbi:MAG: tetratricopeptide repeat protein [Dysgonamonadaceae bacterium]|jgi:tetratricopeptide (TPR) repeat protein|nr:tetratricopeptide repeat protein [Dysgonamonadaceae bacterium]